MGQVVVGSVDDREIGRMVYPGSYATHKCILCEKCSLDGFVLHVSDAVEEWAYCKLGNTPCVSL